MWGLSLQGSNSWRQVQCGHGLRQSLYSTTAWTTLREAHAPKVTGTPLRKSCDFLCPLLLGASGSPRPSHTGHAYLFLICGQLYMPSLCVHYRVSLTQLRSYLACLGLPAGHLWLRASSRPFLWPITCGMRKENKLVPFSSVQLS